MPPRPKRGLAVVTGASGGIGLEFCKLLARDGYDLALVARSREKLEGVATGLRGQYGVDATPIVLDLSKYDSARELIRAVPACDVLINNAGFGTYGRFDRIPEELVAEELSLDVVTLTRLTRAYLPGMIERGNGKVLNVASTAGFLPGPLMAVYYASKAYVLSFSQALAEELRGSGVTVTCLAPGATATGFSDRAGHSKSLLFRMAVGDPAKVARDGYRGMQRGKLLVVARPATNLLVELGARFTPRRPLLWMSRKAVEVKDADAPS